MQANFNKSQFHIANDLPGLKNTLSYYDTAAKLALVILVIGYQTSTAIDEKDDKSRTLQNRLLRTAFIYGSIATIYYFYQTTKIINQIEYATNMSRYCIDHIPTHIEVS